jgi:asparagine synthetase B (glutamine-hydrolysing)
MAGVIGAVGVGAAASVVERGAVPLLRRPWHSLRCCSDATGETAVGFAGERGGVVRDAATGVIAAVDGELLDGRSMVTGDRAAGILLARFVERGPALDVPDGWFAAAIWDPRDRSLCLVSDRMGHRPVYYARRGTEVLFAGELKALVAAGLEPRLDPQAWAELLAFEYPLADHCALEGVRVVMPATTLLIRRDGTELGRERWRFRLEPAASGDEGALVGELVRTLEAAVSRRLDDGTALALSGGIDSRCLAALLGARVPGATAVTWGAPGSEDLEIGTTAGRLAGLSSLRLPLEPGYIERGASDTVWLTDGQVRCLHAHHLALLGVRGETGTTSLMIGFAGDPVLRNFRGVPPEEAPLGDALYGVLGACVGDALSAEVLQPRFAAELRGRARDELCRLIAEEEGSRAVRVRQYVWRHSHRRKVLPGSELFYDELTPRDPYDDADVIELCRRLPESLREDGRLQRRLLEAHPALAALRNPKDALPPSLDGRRRTLASFRVKAARRLRRELERRVGVHGRTSLGLGDYAADLRGASASLLGVLLEPRTLERGQLREAGVRRLVDETLSGRARHTRALGMLLTLELFQRQFVDGEAVVPARAA